MSFDDKVVHQLALLREQNLFRELRRVDSPQAPEIEIADRRLLNFSSNDYLGLANHPAVKRAAAAAIDKFGAGAGASRLVCGSLEPFHELEAALAQFKKTKAALTFSSGYAAAQGAIGALVGSTDIIILDKLVHASIVDAAKLSGAKLRVFAHNDLEDLEKKLKWAANTRSPAADKHILVVTESIFSMDGDAAPLREIVALKEKHDAWLMVDEAHATGIIGQNGRGLAEHFGVSHQIEVQMGTLGKALGASGGFICGSRPLIDLLVNRARSFIFSTAPVPAAAAAAAAAIQLTQSAEGETLRQGLEARITEFHSGIGNQKPNVLSAIVPIILGSESKAVEAAKNLLTQNLFVPAIRYPAVARGSARLRVTLSAAHTVEQVSSLIAALKKWDIGI